MKDEDKPCWRCKHLDEWGGCSLNNGVSPTWLKETDTDNYSCFVDS